MKTAKTLNELAAELERQANAKRDYVARTEALDLEIVDDVPQLRVGNDRFAINELAHDQIGQYAEIPSAYYDRMRREAPELLAKNVNTWLHQGRGDMTRQPAKRMIRTLDGTVRAFLSDRFRPIENFDLAMTILPVLIDANRFDVMSSDITERKFYLKVVDKSVNRKLAETGNYLGDGRHQIVRIAAPAITISNSECGFGALSIQAGIYDQFCSNLATFAERSMKKYHIGSRHDLLGEDVAALLSQETQTLTNAALMAQIRDVVTVAFNKERFDELCDKVDGTTQDVIGRETDVVKLVNLSSRKLGITEVEQKGVLQQLITGGDLTRFGLYNAITRFSADVPSYDRATELERIGGQVVELTKTDWEVLINQSKN